MTTIFSSPSIPSNVELVKTETCGTTGTTWTITGLSINSAGSYLLVFKMKNAIVGATTIRCMVNDDVTVTNYYSQNSSADTSTIGTSRSNDAAFCYVAGSGESTGYAIITKGIDGYIRIFVNASYGATSTISNQWKVITKTATVTDVTTLNFVSQTANAIHEDSTATIYKLGV